MYQLSPKCTNSSPKCANSLPWRGRCHNNSSPGVVEEKKVNIYHGKKKFDFLTRGILTTHRTNTTYPAKWSRGLALTRYDKRKRKKWSPGKSWTATSFMNSCDSSFFSKNFPFGLAFRVASRARRRLGPRPTDAEHFVVSKISVRNTSAKSRAPILLK